MATPAGSAAWGAIGALAAATGAAAARCGGGCASCFACAVPGAGLLVAALLQRRGRRAPAGSEGPAGAGLVGLEGSASSGPERSTT